MIANIKEMIATIPNRWKAIYIVWVFVHFAFLLMANPYREHYFYPFKGFDSRHYDYSEFLIYSIAPIIIFLVIKLWIKKDKKD